MQAQLRGNKLWLPQQQLIHIEQLRQFCFIPPIKNEVYEVLRKFCCLWRRKNIKWQPWNSSGSRNLQPMAYDNQQRPGFKYMGLSQSFELYLWKQQNVWPRPSLIIYLSHFLLSTYPAHQLISASQILHSGPLLSEVRQWQLAACLWSSLPCRARLAPS